MPNTKLRHRELLRMASRLQEALAETPPRHSPSLPDSQWQECQRLSRLRDAAVHRGWLRAAQEIQRRLTRAFEEFKESLDLFLSHDLERTFRPHPSFKELYHELRGLLEEFPHTEFDLGDDTIAVITDSITLENVVLGAFRIELTVMPVYPGLSYTILAMDANPAAQNEEVTHPHVQDGQLCEGEGRMPIRNALREGRLTDFFQIVNQILETYNPSNPYVALSDWEGVACSGCGATTYDEERTSCSTSGDVLCYECAVTCPDCDSDFSMEFTSRCDTCEQRCCDRCLEGGICHDCQNELETKETPTVSTGLGIGGRASHREPVGQAVR